MWTLWAPPGTRGILEITFSSSTDASRPDTDSIALKSPHPSSISTTDMDADSENNLEQLCWWVDGLFRSSGCVEHPWNGRPTLTWVLWHVPDWHLRGHTWGLTEFINNLHTIHAQYFIYTAISLLVTRKSSGFCLKFRFIFNLCSSAKQHLRFWEARSRNLDHFIL